MIKQLFDFISRWRKIGKARGMPFYHIGNKVPKWVENRYWDLWRKKQLYGTTIYMKGKRRRYKIVTHWPTIQGETPRIYYMKKK